MRTIDITLKHLNEYTFYKDKIFVPSDNPDTFYVAQSMDPTIDYCMDAFTRALYRESEGE